MEQPTLRSTVNPASRLDPKRARYITENFSKLQGLNGAALGAGLAVWQMVDTYWRNSGWASLAVVPFIGANLALFIYLPRYYRDRFGWIQPRPSATVRSTGWIADASDKKLFLVVSVTVVFFAVFALAIWVVVDLAQHALHMQLALTPLSYWLILSVVALWFRQSIGWSKLWAIFAMAVASAFATFYPLGHPMNGTDLLLLRTLNAGSIGLFLVAWGLYNHIKLLRLMPARVAEDDHE